MKFAYKNVSNGYIGKQHAEGTLNSQYYAHFFEEIIRSPHLLSTIHIFPQRIPRAGFFDELYTLETSQFKKAFSNIKRFIKSNYKKSLHNLLDKNTEENARIFINWGNISLRYGCFDTISDNVLATYSGPYLLEIEILRQTNKLEKLLSDGLTISVNNLLEIAKKYIPSNNATDREKMMLLNRIVVYFYKHEKKSFYRDEIVSLSKLLLAFSKQFENSNFINMIYTSIAYRGLSMVVEFGEKNQNSILKKAEILARNIKFNSKFEKIVATENLYTCLQSVAKWHMQNNRIANAENCFAEMITIDQNDSTAYSELGFLYAKAGNHGEAAMQFKKAMDLGPPGTGMNAYYYANCLQQMGDESEAITYLYQSADLDKQALSPWLDLLNYFSAKNQADKTISIATHILNTSVLKEQLEDDEITSIQNFIK